jgi:ribosomal protein S18 acetylase RimI-like enzyme
MTVTRSASLSERVRLATPEDADGLADVHVRTWQRAYRDIFSPDFLESLDRGRRSEWWRRQIEDGARVHVAEVDRVVGFCSTGASDRDGWGEILAIYVHPDRWGHGLGSDLLRAGEAELSNAGFERALLWVLEENRRARAFYEAHGWEMGQPVRLEEIGGRQVTEVIYEKDLTAGP